MRVGNYKVHFQYEQCLKELHTKTTKQDCARCIIEEYTGDKDNPYREVINSSIKRYHKDPPATKAQVRKMVFKQAISGFDKATREKFWNAYKQTIKLN